MGKKTSFTTEKFINYCKDRYGDKYDYSKTIYTRDDENVIVTCNIHGDFTILANGMKHKHGCQKCAEIIRIGKKRLSKEQFIERARKKHGFKYNYDLIKLNGVRVKVDIICPKHGIFRQIAYYHLNGNGCQKCDRSTGEDKIATYLDRLGVQYEIDMDLGCRNPKTNSPLLFDFYLPFYKHVIEYDGMQHFQPVRFSAKQTDTEIKENYEQQIFKDSIKKEWCFNNGYSLLRIHYKDFKRVERIIDDEIISD